MPSGRQENALPANIPGDANLELLKHQSENEQDLSPYYILSMRKKRDFLRVVDAQRE